MFVNHLCELKGEQDGEADKAEEGFCELVIASGNAPIALDFFEEVFYPVTTPVDGCREWHSRSAVSASRNAGSVLPPKKRTRDSRFSLVCYRRNQGTLSPEPPGIFRFGLAPAGPAGPAGRPEAATLRPRRALSSGTAWILCQVSILVSITRLNSVSYWFGVS